MRRTIRNVTRLIVTVWKRYALTFFMHMLFRELLLIAWASSESLSVGIATV